MSDPFSGIPDPKIPRPIRRRFEPGLVQEALRAMRDSLRATLPPATRALQRTSQTATEAFRRAQRQGQDLWRRGRREPRTVGLIAGAVALTLAGAYTLSASAAGRSQCPPTSTGKTPKFLLLMDTVAQASAGSELEMLYDVCGLPSGTTYRGRVRFTPQRTAGKKGSTKIKAQVVSFKDEADGVATRRQQLLSLASTKPGGYTLTLSVTDSRGRERTRVQNVLVKPR